MADETLDAERLEEIARGFEGYPTPVDHQGKCWFCNGGLGHGPRGHAESCIWVHRDDLADAIAALRARLAAAEARADRLAYWLKAYHGVIGANAWRNGNLGEIDAIDAALAEHDAAVKGE